MKKIKFLAILLLLPLLLPSTVFALDQSRAGQLRGYILLQVEEHGEAWYVHPESGLRYYMPDGDSAYQLMRFHSLGISDEDLSKIPSVLSVGMVNVQQTVCGSNPLAKQLRGRILLQVQQHGEAWYVDPDTCFRVYMKDGSEAYSIMRLLSLGITNDDLSGLTEHPDFTPETLRKPEEKSAEHSEQEVESEESPKSETEESEPDQIRTEEMPTDEAEEEEEPAEPEKTPITFELRLDTNDAHNTGQDDKCGIVIPNDDPRNLVEGFLPVGENSGWPTNTTLVVFSAHNPQGFEYEKVVLNELVLKNSGTADLSTLALAVDTNKGLVVDSVTADTIRIVNSTGQYFSGFNLRFDPANAVVGETISLYAESASFSTNDPAFSINQTASFPNYMETPRIINICEFIQ